MDVPPIIRRHFGWIEAAIFEIVDEVECRLDPPAFIEAEQDFRGGPYAGHTGKRVARRPCTEHIEAPEFASEGAVPPANVAKDSAGHEPGECVAAIEIGLALGMTETQPVIEQIVEKVNLHLGQRRRHG